MWKTSWAWWNTFVIPAHGMWKQEDVELKASWSYIARSCLKLNNNNQKTK
jgi:hypothetical protein